MKTTAFRFLLFLGKKFEFQGCICPCCAHLTSASDDEVAVEQGGGPGGIVGGDVLVPGKHGGEDSKGRLGKLDSF